MESKAILDNFHSKISFTGTSKQVGFRRKIWVKFEETAVFLNKDIDGNTYSDSISYEKQAGNDLRGPGDPGTGLSSSAD
ncbi:hypothetical protein AYI70_g8549 [Smittium culicis]|uniref:Uncharacterized protein n=1 Tax=Smittium culicis TaxID=133412 RepID=A0A1R1XFI1_9FUNG|nr:hypothetical protein AYI70_g8549 [Smittium culicis]